ncbi:nitrite transporter [Rosenbergiella nectarea]|uniref:nitrite transporter n=1 Tax=Rosenbergiella nectarea TaxID=988801 RepID=UPI001F4E2AEE|nr:nitrite transporter [Rosenbergiella nectarea]
MFCPDKYLTAKWQMGGRVYPILDCYGLVHEIRSDLGLEAWPLFESVIREGVMMGTFCEEFKGSVSRCEAKVGAVAACYIGGLISHLGIVVEINGDMLVAESNPRKNVTFLPVTRFERQYQKVEYYH